MNKKLKLVFLSVFLLSILPRIGFSQYQDFPNNCWQQRGAFEEQVIGNQPLLPMVITYLQDTLVCNKKYKECLYEGGWPTYPLNSYLYIRNDTGKIYLSNGHPTCPDSSLFILDFNQMPGDTFSFVGSVGNYTDTVLSVSSQTIGGSIRKVITYKHGLNLIDGIGDSNNGLLYWDVGFEGGHHILVCQHDSAGDVYINPNITGPFPNDPTHKLNICDSITTTDACQIVTAGNNINQGNHILLYPNPVSEFLCFNNLKSFEVNISYSIINIIGQVRTEGILSVDNSKDVVRVNDLPSGLYFIRLNENNNYIETLRFVKE